MIANKAFHEIIIVLFLIFWLITIFFSLLVLIIIISYWRTHCRSIINLLTCNSCVTLIVFVITVSPQTPSFIQRLYYDIPPPTQAVCQIYVCLATFGTAIEVYSYLVHAVSRFFITILYKYKSLLTYRTNWIMIIISWITGGVVGISTFISPSVSEFEPESNFCMFTTKNFLTSFLSIIIIPMITMIIITILYGIILYHTVQRTRTNPTSIATLRVNRNIKVFKRIFFSISLFGIGAPPYLTCIIWNRIDRAPWPLYSISLLSMSLAAVLNSIVLLVTNDQVKEILLTKLTGRQTNRMKHVKIIKINQIAPNLLE